MTEPTDLATALAATCAAVCAAAQASTPTRADWPTIEALARELFAEDLSRHGPDSARPWEVLPGLLDWETLGSRAQAGYLGMAQSVWRLRRAAELAAGASHEASP
jgi:hypothetical protein